MTDLSPLQILPRDIGSIDGLKPESAPRAPSSERSPEFQEILRRTLGNVSRDADQVEQAVSPSFAEMQKAMETAKTAFADTMQAHQLMQNLLRGLGDGQGSDAEPKE